MGFHSSRTVVDPESGQEPATIAAAAVHDLKNVLSNIIGHLDLAIQDLEPSSPSERHLRAAERVARYARDIAFKVLDGISGKDRVPNEVSAIELAGVAADLMVNPGLYRVDLDIPGPCLLVRMSPIRLMQVLTNLLSNAVQSMPIGGRVLIRIQAGENHTVVIEVADEGGGVPPHMIDCLFEPGSSSRLGGHGIGLAVVRDHVRDAGGEVAVENAEAGAVFRVTLPGSEAVDDLSIDHPDEPLAIPGADLDSATILVMDDDPMVREITGAMLEHLGFQTRFASDGLEAEERYRAARDKGEPFSLVLMDLNIPGGHGGVSTLERLRKIDPAIRAVVTSGMSGDPAMVNYRDHGFIARIAKPYNLKELDRMLREALGRSS